MWNIIQIKTLFHPSCMKTVYNALIHPYRNYAVLNWGRASKTVIQPLVDLQNKAVKFLKTPNKANLDEIYTQNNILTINNLFKMFAGKFMHSHENSQLPSHFNQYFKSIQTVHMYPTRLLVQSTKWTFFSSSFVVQSLWFVSFDFFQ